MASYPQLIPIVTTSTMKFILPKIPTVDPFQIPHSTLHPSHSTLHTHHYRIRGVPHGRLSSVFFKFSNEKQSAIFLAPWVWRQPKGGDLVMMVISIIRTQVVLRLSAVPTMT